MATSDAMTNAGAQGILDLLFENTDFAKVGDAAGLQNSATAGSFYISLHTGDPGAAGVQTTNEAAYTSYARVAVARSAAGWTRASQTVTNDAAVAFPKATGGSETETWVGLGTDSSGAGVLLFAALLDTEVVVVSGVTPQIPALGLSITLT